MTIRTRLAAIAGAAALTSIASASVGGSYTWSITPGSDMDAVYSLNWTGRFESDNPNSLVDPNHHVSADLLSAQAQAQINGGVAAVIDPAYIGYDLVGFNATITGIYIVSVTDTGNVNWTGAQWVSGIQVGTLFHYAGTGFSGAANAFTAGPASLAYAGSPDGDGLASVGQFNPNISNIAIAPVLTAINPNNSFGVTITGITAVPEPGTFVALGMGLAALAALRRKK